MTLSEVERKFLHQIHANPFPSAEAWKRKRWLAVVDRLKEKGLVVEGSEDDEEEGWLWLTEAGLKEIGRQP